MQRLYGLRRYHNETSGNAIIAQEGLSNYECIAEIGTKAAQESVIDSALGQSGGSLGENATNTNYKYILKRQVLVIHFRNVTNHPQFLHIYTIAPKKQISLGSESNACGLMMQDLSDGWKQDMGDGSTTTTTKSGDNIVSGVTSTSVSTYSHHWKLAYSRRFMDRWKVVKSKSYKLDPGDDVFWTVKVPGGIYNPNAMIPSTGDPVEIPKTSRIVVTKLTGVLAESAATANNFLSMETETAYEYVHKAQVIPYNIHVNEMSAQITHDAILTDYHAPSAHVKTDDEN
jgi:hypothetical protein